MGGRLFKHLLLIGNGTYWGFAFTQNIVLREQRYKLLYCWYPTASQLSKMYSGSNDSYC